MNAAADSARRTPVVGRLSSGRLIDLAYRARAFGILAALAVLIVVTSAIQPRFLSGNEVNIVLGNTTILALLSLGEAMVVITRNVDLSVGSVLGLSAYASGNIFGHLHGMSTGTSIVIAFLVGIGVGIACGVVNGALVTIGQVPSLVVTLATLYIIRGIDILDHRRRPGRRELAARCVLRDLAEELLQRAVPCARGRRPSSASARTTCVRSAPAATCTRSARNPQAARLVGIPTGRRVFTAFVVSGALAGVAGVLWASKYGTLDSTAGSGYELSVIAAVVIGGVAIFGGSGSVIGAALGALLLSTILAALYVVGVSPFWTQAISGALILVAISIDRVISLQLTVGTAKKEGPCRSGMTSSSGCAPLVRWETGLFVALLVIVFSRDASLVAVPDEGQPLLPLPLDRRGRDHDAAAHADHHHGRDRPLRGVDPRPRQRHARLPRQATAGRCGSASSS